MKNSHLLALPVLFLVIISIMFISTPNDSSPNRQQAAVGSAAITFKGHLSPQEFKALSKEKGVIIIDVRTPAEFEAGHLDQAVNIDFYDPNFIGELNRLEKNQKYLIYCRSGHRSGEALMIMKELGFVNVADLDGGYLALIK